MPITLCVVAMEVGKRRGVPIRGVGLPGHFVIRDRQSGRFADPFGHGLRYDEDGMIASWQQRMGEDSTFKRSMLRATSAHDIVLRILNNLKQSLVSRDEPVLLARLAPLRAGVPRTVGRARGASSMAATLQLMIDATIKRSLGQMMKGVQVVGAHHEGVTRAYCSHWVCQVSFEEPILMASVSPKHDTHPLIARSGEFAVSILAGDQVDVGQYFSYPGRKFRYIADEYLETIPETDLPVVRNCIAWLRCATFEVKRMVDHDLFFARVVDVGAGRLKEPPLLYSSRLGWRVTGDKARQPGRSIRDELLARLAAAGFDEPVGEDDDE